jgi:hypothetical protein
LGAADSEAGALADVLEGGGVVVEEMVAAVGVLAWAVEALVRPALVAVEAVEGEPDPQPAINSPTAAASAPSAAVDPGDPRARRVNGTSQPRFLIGP